MMKIYCLDSLFIFSGHTLQQYPYIVAGSLAGDKRSLSLLSNELNSLLLPAGLDPREIDMVLAGILTHYSTDLELAGCTIGVRGIFASCGGVLGNPGIEPQSAMSFFEDAGNGWQLLAYPGGPGIALRTVAEGERSQFARECFAGLTGGELLSAVARKASLAGVKNFIGITDGSGSTARGSAMIQRDDTYVLWSLEEV
jgi:hypothetical protein